MRGDLPTVGLDERLGNRQPQPGPPRPDPIPPGLEVVVWLGARKSQGANPGIR
ncbi:MAG: hypothetical protein HZB27_00020 [Meiothermus silvanus]|nr:hypothetical protein [Allomeiothermus silvanus]